MSWFDRLRHTLGFGVHSPFSFRFVKECIKEKCPYYAYTRLQTSDQRLLFRIAAYLQPTEITAVGKASDKAARMACPPRADRRPGPAVTGAGIESTKLAVVDTSATAETILKLVQDGWTVLALLDKQRKSIVDSIEQHLNSCGHGILFRNRRGKAIVIPHASLPRMSYDINF